MKCAELEDAVRGEPGPLYDEGRSFPGPVLVLLKKIARISEVCMTSGLLYDIKNRFLLFCSISCSSIT